MMSEPDYYSATNKAYELLCEFGMFSPPYSVFDAICKIPKCVVMSYTEASEKYKTDRSVWMSSSDHGFTILNKFQNSIILYNDFKDHEISRFTVAHELGHVVLGHEQECSSTNKEANCFARNFLCPVPAAHYMGLTTSLEYAEFFDVTKVMADTTMDFVSCDARIISDEYYEIFSAGIERFDRAARQYRSIPAPLSIRNLQSACTY